VDMTTQSAECNNVLRVLVCDDEPGMRTGAARALRDFTMEVRDLGETFRFVVEQAETGEQAIEMAERAQRGAGPDILLLDHKLPGISGLEVLDYFAAKKTDMLTIVITAYASIETAVRATKQGAYDFLPKPFTPAELKNAVRKASEHVIVAQQVRKLAREKHQVRFQFISVLAHELKSPLSAVEGYLNILENPAVTENPGTYAHIISRCSSRMSYMRKMITDLLDLTRIESGQKKRELVLVDVREVAEVAIDSATPEATERGIEIVLATDQPVMLLADASEIEIVFNNLVSNAVKYNRDQGRVDVTVKEADDFVTVTVKDTGIGMTQEESAKLFNDFVRIKNEKTQNILGSGLGLSIVKKIAGLYDGHVAVESNSDTGSTFTVTLRNARNETVPTENPIQPL
jgi:two-component system, sensor histidine kinase and response regulator